MPKGRGGRADNKYKDMKACLALLFCLALRPAPAAAAPAQLERAAAEIADPVGGAIPAGRTVAVAPFRSPDGSISMLGGMLADRVTAILIKGGGVTVLDRRYTARLLGELRFAASGAVSGGPEAGGFSGADFILTGVLSQAGGDISADARLLETATGRAAASAHSIIPAIPEIKSLYSQVSALDSAAESAAEGGTAYFTARAGVDGCRWVRASAHADGPAGLARAKAVLAARRAAAALAGLPGRPAVPAREEYVGRAEGGGWTAELESCLRQAGPGENRGISAELLLSRAEFRAGESASAFITVSTPAYVFLYNSGAGAAVSLAWRGYAEPGRPLLLPRDAPGSDLRAAAPEGDGCSAEIFQLLAFGAAGKAPELPAYTSLPALLSAADSGAAGWASDYRPFTVCR